MTYEVRTARRADAYLRRLNPATERRIAKRLEEIAADPYGSHSQGLSNAEGQRKSRVGGYRIVFRVNDAEQIVNVDAIGPRGRVYRDVGMTSIRAGRGPFGTLLARRTDDDRRGRLLAGRDDDGRERDARSAPGIPG